MEQIVSVIGFISLNYQAIIAAVIGILVALVAILSGMITISLMIPGPQPEKNLQGIVDFLQRIVDFLSKFSKK